MAKKDETVETTEFPITLDEFVGGLKQVEMAAAFRAQMRGSRQALPSEWMHFYNLFQTKPVDTPWVEWIQKKGGN